MALVQRLPLSHQEMKSQSRYVMRYRVLEKSDSERGRASFPEASRPAGVARDCVKGIGDGSERGEARFLSLSLSVRFVFSRLLRRSGRIKQPHVSGPPLAHYYLSAASLQSNLRPAARLRTSAAVPICTAAACRNFHQRRALSNHVSVTHTN